MGHDVQDIQRGATGQGINLAAEFLDNPFCPAFDSMDKKVAEKMDFQIFMVTFWLGQRAPVLAATLPDKTKNFADIDTNLREINDGINADLAGAIQPVTHTIKIEEVK